MMQSVRAFAAVAVSGVVILGCSSTDSVVPPSSPSHVAFENQPPASISAGQPLGNVNVYLLSADGKLVTGGAYTVTIALSASDTAAHLAGTTSVQTNTGVATFPDLAVARIGTGFKLIARVTGLDSATSQPFTITRGPASQLRFDLLGTVGVGAEVPAVVRVTDAGGNVVPDATASITVGYARTGSFGFTAAPDDTFGPVTATAVNGVATVHGLVFHKSGTYTLSASAPGLLPASTTTSPPPFGSGLAILGVSMTRLLFVTQPSDGTPGAPLPTFSVQQVDDFGNGLGLPPGGSYTVTISLGTNPTGANLGGTLTAQNFGVFALSFNNVTIDKPGTGYTLVATSPGLRSATSAPFNIK